MARLGDSNLDLPSRRLARVGSLEDLAQLLKRLALGLNEEEVDLESN